MVVHVSGESVILRDALVLIWDAMDRPRGIDEIVSALAATAAEQEGVRLHLLEALTWMSWHGLAEEVS